MPESNAAEALAQLIDGNRRFAAGKPTFDGHIDAKRRKRLVAGQNPFAVVLGCSDSRAPVEILFDQGLGDLFVIRVAGNVVASSQIGSVEFAAAQFGVRLVVVLGHSHCGAVTATIDALRKPDQLASSSLRSIVDRIRPSVEGLLPTLGSEQDAGRLMHEAVRSNVRMAANQLRNGSPLLEKLIVSDGLLVVGAEYSLESGLVDFFDGVPLGMNTSPGQAQVGS